MLKSNFSFSRLYLKDETKYKNKLSRLESNINLTDLIFVKVMHKLDSMEKKSLDGKLEDDFLLKLAGKSVGKNK